MDNQEIKKIDGFNDEQSSAITNPIDIDLLISAGAGSGKTKTLSEKVYYLVKDGLVAPSQLLVLTFTNNAAHEMKTRIIKRIKKEHPDIANQMVSAHIQTFDSFSQFLVCSYSGRLGISDRLSIANQDVLTSKRSEYLDQIFEEYYADKDKCARLTKTLMKYNSQDDKATKAVILSLSNELDKLIPSKRNAIINDYDNRYLSKEAFNRYLDEFTRIQKEKIIQKIEEAYLIEKHGELLLEKEKFDADAYKALFKDKSFFDLDYSNLTFDNTDINQLFYLKLKELLKIDDDKQFINAIRHFIEDNASLFLNGKRLTAKSFKENPNDQQVYNVLSQLFCTANKDLDFDLISEDLDKEYQVLLDKKEDISLILEIINELNKRLADYKRTTNCFSFSDISNMALALLIDPKYEDVAIEVRSKFKYIMVDEYQDTNDFQELFLSSLLKTNEHGERAHLFCVGDAKQSIYAFRNSNVELFRNRQKEYSDGDASHQVIAMNKNYRSGKKLLQDINYIFNYYMTLEHGSIDYSSFMEQLQYDDKVNIYSKEYDNFGVKRITSVSGFNNDNYPGSEAEWEALAIANDIKKKKNDGFLVYKEGELKPCDYNDFVILMRTKKGYSLYQRIFNEYGIKLNSDSSTGLREIDAVLLLQSLIELISSKINKIKCDEKHLFASIARSYAYQYSDQTIFDIITGDESLLKQDKIMLDIDDFVERNQKSSFNELFLDLVNTFHVVENLYYIGNVSDNVSKIESIHQMVLAKEQAGEGIKEFVELYKSISKFDLDLSADSVIQVNDAVDMMTIHASKGLERKIVYMPNAFNSLGTGGNNKTDYTFSYENGILLPNYNFDVNDVFFDEDGNSFIKDVNIKTLPEVVMNLSSKDEERNEHVRLFYVALTRAQNTVYLVGDPKDETIKTEESNKKSENLIGMLSYAPHYPLLNGEFIKSKFNIIPELKPIYDEYLLLIDEIKELEISLTAFDLDTQKYQNYVYLWQKYYRLKMYEEINKKVDEIKKQLFGYYYRLFSAIKSDKNIQVKLFARYTFGVKVNNYEDLEQYILSLVNKDEEDEEDDIASDDGEEIKQEKQDYVINPKELGTAITGFIAALLTGNYAYFGISKTAAKSMQTADKKAGIPFGLKDALVPTFVDVFDNVQSLLKISYKNKDFNDDNYAFDYHTLEETEEKQAKVDDYPLPNRVNDDAFNFEIRKHRHASKPKVEDEDVVPNEILERGTYLHRLMELVDFKTKDTSFIKNEKDRALIDKVLTNSLFDDMEHKTVYKEYGYYDEDLETSGFIDMMYVYNGEFYIVDYKSSHVEDDDYQNQLHTYQRNIQRIFKVDRNKIHLMLLSLKDNRILEVEPY